MSFVLLPNDEFVLSGCAWLIYHDLRYVVCDAGYAWWGDANDSVGKYFFN